MIEFLLLCAASYLLGSVPFGLLLTRAAGMGDIRNIGSGNIGATNVLRTGNKPLAAATLILDGAKGAVAVLLIHRLTGDDMLAIYGGLFAVIGHIFPVWLRFKGGKGVATALGYFLAVYWPLGLGLLIVWLVMALLFRMSSLAALTAFIVCPLLAAMMDQGNVFIPALALLFLIAWKHEANIRRIIGGTEPKIGQKKEGAQ